MILAEDIGFKKYAIFTLSDMLVRPVCYDPFNPRSHNHDLMHRRSTFGDKFRNAFKNKPAVTHSPLRPASSSSSVVSAFGRSLEDVCVLSFVPVF
jgi:hypothetical protein